MSKLVEVNEKIAEAVVEGYKKIEDGVVKGYKKIEKGAVDGFDKMNDKIIEKVFAKDGETVEDARKRLLGGIADSEETAEAVTETVEAEVVTETVEAEAVTENESEN